MLCPFTITESAGIARIAHLMRFPIAIFLPQSLALLNISTCRVLDSTGAVVPAQFRIIARYGEPGDATKAIRILHVIMQPTVSANATVSYSLDTAGGSGDSTGGIVVTTDAGYYEIDTGPLGCVARVPRTGPQSLLRYLAIGNTGGSLAETWTHADSPGSLSADLNWVILNGTRWGIVSNKARVSGGPTSGVEWARVVGFAGSANHTVTAILGNFARGAANDVGIGIVARQDGSSNLTGYQFVVSLTAAGNSIALYSTIAGVGTLLSEVVFTVESNDVIELAVNGTSISGRVNDVERVSATDSSITTGQGGAVTGYWENGTGAMLEFTDFGMSWSGGATTIINSDSSGLWAHGVATAQDVLDTVNSQDADYYSKNDTTGGATDTFLETETSPLSTYATSIRQQGPLKVEIKIDNVRMKSAGGVAFKGMNIEVDDGGATSTPRDVTQDIYLTFHYNSPAIHWRKRNNGTQGRTSGGLRSDIAYRGEGFELVTAFGSLEAVVTTRDEGDANKVASAVTSSAISVRQNHAKSGQSYGWSLSTVGITLDAATTQLEHFVDLTAADSSRGLIIAAWNVRNKFPYGFSIINDGTTIRLETLADGIKDTNPGSSVAPAQKDYHVQLGSQWKYDEGWIIPHVGVLTATQIRDTVRSLIGKHETRDSGSYVDSTATGGGGQQISSLTGRQVPHTIPIDAWWPIGPESLSIPATSLKNLAAKASLLGGASRFDDAFIRNRRWTEVLIDGSLIVPADLSAREYQALGYTGADGPLGWRFCGCFPTSGGQMAPNDYNINQYTAEHWLRTGERGLHSLWWEMITHHVCIDQFHSGYSHTESASGKISSVNNPSTRYHESGTSFGNEVQQFHEAPAFAYALTGEDMFLDSLKFVINWFDRNQRCRVGESFVASFHDVRNRLNTLGDLANGSTSVTNVTDTTGAIILTDGPICRYRTESFGLRGAQATTITSSGTTVTASGNVSDIVGLGVTHAANKGAHVGAVIQDTATGLFYTIKSLTDATHFELMVAPNPALAGANWRYYHIPGFGALTQVTAIGAGTLTHRRRDDFSAPVGNMPGAKIYGVPVSFTRMVTWLASSFAATVLLLGRYVQNAQSTGNGWDLLERVKDCALYMLHSEQFWSSEGAKAQMGGFGGWMHHDPVQGGGDSFSATAIHGSQAELIHNYQAYPIIPLIKCHQIMDWAAKNGYSAVISQAEADSILNLLDRYCRLMFMGVDGLSPITGYSGNLIGMAGRTIPWARGGHQLSDTSIYPLSTMGRFVVVEEPAIRTNFYGCAENLSRLSHTPNDADCWSQDIGNAAIVAMGSDVLTYVALNKHQNDPARRAAYIQRAIDAYVSIFTHYGSNEINSQVTDGKVWGSTMNPEAFGGTDTGWHAFGGAYGHTRLKGWMLASNQRLIRFLADGGFKRTSGNVASRSIASRSVTTARVIRGPGIG